MKKRIIILIVSTLFVAQGCSNDELEVAISEGFEELSGQDNEVIFRQSSTSGRTTLINRSILPEVRRDRLIDENGREVSQAQLRNQQEYYWTWVANVSSPVVDGYTLSATHCNIVGSRAYISYNKQGDIHRGSLEIIDINDPANPFIDMQVDFLLADINAITVENSSIVWLAASHKNHGATVYKINVDTQQVDRINLSNSLAGGISASANGIAITNDFLIVSAGKTFGGTFFLDKNSLEVVSVDPYSNCKYVDVIGPENNTTYISLVTGASAQIKTGIVNEQSLENEWPLGNITHTNVNEANRGKNTLHLDPFNDDRVYVAMAREGLKAFDIATGMQTNISSGTMLLEGNTNGVTLDEDYMYIANGADGIAIGDHVSSGEEINPMFVWDKAEQPASVNYVTAQNDWIFVCKGLGGFDILYKQERAPYITISPYNEIGTPITMEPDEVVCETLLPTLFEVVLPERQNAIEAHPEYFAHPAKNIHITQNAEVKITFLNEGAGYKNILGYYAYNASDPPQTVDDLEKIIVFPNCSAQGSGGELIKGNTMKLLGEFEAGTKIGFFIIADGWRNGEITEGHYTQYMDQILNNNQQQQSLIFYETSCDAIVISFEDITVPNGDKDFNDAIFQVHSDPPSAVDTSAYFQIN